MTESGDLELLNGRDVSPAWLSRALARDFRGVKVSAVRPESLHEGTASTCRLHVDYASSSAAGPATVCIKSDFGLEHMQRLADAGLYRKEALVYKNILPAADTRVARCYAANYNSDGRGFMVLEDLTAAGATFLHPTSGLTVAQVKTGVDALAKLHASTWDKPWLHGPDWMHHGKPLSEIDPFWDVVFERWEEGLANHPHSGAIARPFRDRQIMQRAFNRLRGMQDKVARCLVHGDAHVGNFYADRNGDVGVADFQCVQRGDVAHDLTTFIVSSLDVLDRREGERDLLQHYVGYLKELGVADPPSFEQVWLGYRRHLIYSLVTWLFTSVLQQPQLDCVANMHRFGTAALDLDTLGAFSEEPIAGVPR
jgi:aminoglycoside phosphotransferase (APT) family kinase protein